MISRQELEMHVARLGNIQPWNHNFQLPFGVETRPGIQVSHGKNLVKLERLRPILEKIGMAGKIALDVGCNEGFFSIYLAKNGMKVLGIDVDENRINKANFIKSVLGCGHVDFQVIDIYSQQFNELPKFDLGLCLGFLHRVPDPYTAMAILVAKCDLIVFEWKALKFGPHDDAFAYFSPKPVDKEDYYGTEYWLLSYAAVERILTRLGFRYFYRLDDPRQRRAILVAGRVDNPIFAEKDVIYHRGRVRTLLSHGKRFVKTVIGIMNGRVNS